MKKEKRENVKRNKKERDEVGNLLASRQAQVPFSLDLNIVNVGDNTMVVGSAFHGLITSILRGMHGESFCLWFE